MVMTEAAAPVPDGSRGSASLDRRGPSAFDCGLGRRPVRGDVRWIRKRNRGPQGRAADGGDLSQPQILRSAGIPLKAAEFVRRQEEWGLRLTPEGEEAKPLILDIANRSIGPAEEGWQAAAADAAGWSVTAEEGSSLAVKGPKGIAFRVPVPAGSLVSATAVCPKSPACSVPLVAIATHQNGQPRLQILRGDTGEELRWCVGHTERIRSLLILRGWPDARLRRCRPERRGLDRRQPGEEGSRALRTDCRPGGSQRCGESRGRRRRLPCLSKWET